MSTNKDTQANKYLITINNPREKGLGHDEIKHRLIMNFETLKYFCMADEKGETYHTHIFVCFSSRVRFSKVKKAFNEAHIDQVKGSISDNINYIKKEGKWADSKKSETSIPGTFEKWGKEPKDSKGKRPDMEELYKMIEEGKSNAEILRENQDYILHIDKLDKLRTTILMDKYKGKNREDLKVIYISGKTGTGKTSGVLKEHEAKNVYRVTDYKHPFDSYACEDVICFDEFRSGVFISDMLNYCDIYPICLPARYSQKYACYNTVYIISNWELEKQYEDIKLKDESSREAFFRRISEVWIYEDVGKVKKYTSVKEYFEKGKNN